MHEGRVQRNWNSKSEAVRPRNWNNCWYKHCDNKTRQIGLNHDNIITLFQSVNVCSLNLNANMVLETRATSRAAPIVASRRIVASQCPSSRDAVLLTRCFTPLISMCFNLKQSYEIKHINDESAKLIDGCNVILIPVVGGISHIRCVWLAWRVWRHVDLRYTRDYLTRGLSKLNKPIAMDKMIISCHSPHSHVTIVYKTPYTISRSSVCTYFHNGPRFFM